ncbi:hypothetical protein D8674_013827 [Pyrus ussuriensis x Pyrus communis]|uniref:Uncharacterized protein n=1 Tax=Pyrus ussuriensis x Pyrus communis TaxID=2448454 RepID=A0A5N5GRN8_9ROSA|nr:hypothetical protein D8674_013827 [Pyrus ussuriensis x Pyrus communis]
MNASFFNFDLNFDLVVFEIGELLGNWQLDDEDDPLPRVHDSAASESGQSSGKKKKASFKEKSKNGSRREKSRHEESGSRKDKEKKRMRRWRHSQDSANSFGPYGGTWTR